jgi:hypothetical protein
MIRVLAKPVSVIVIVSLITVTFGLSRGEAAMVGTEMLLRSAQHQQAAARIEEFLDRQEVQAALVSQGVDPAEARARIGSLSGTEVERIAGIVDSLPAGGDAVGAIIGGALLVFFVLLITDILGLTHVFPFVNHGRR